MTVKAATNHRSRSEFGGSA